jgi:hypothetical protein
VTKPAALFVALGAAAIAFVVAYAYPAFASEALPWYYPADHAWVVEVRPTGVAIDLYARLAQACLAWSVVFAVALPIARRRREIGPRAVGLVAAWALTAIAFAMLFFAWTLHYRVPVPVPSEVR